jgi:hypothetical protein
LGVSPPPQAASANTNSKRALYHVFIQLCFCLNDMFFMLQVYGHAEAGIYDSNHKPKKGGKTRKNEEEYGLKTGLWTLFQACVRPR